MSEKTKKVDEEILSILETSNTPLFTRDVVERISPELKCTFPNKKALFIYVLGRLNKLFNVGVVEKKYFGQNVWRLKK